MNNGVKKILLARRDCPFWVREILAKDADQEICNAAKHKEKSLFWHFSRPKKQVK